MNNIEIAAVILIAVGFGFIITKLNKVIELCSVTIALLVKDNIVIDIREEED